MTEFSRLIENCKDGLNSSIRTEYGSDFGDYSFHEYGDSLQELVDVAARASMSGRAQSVWRRLSGVIAKLRRRTASALPLDEEVLVSRFEGLIERLRENDVLERMSPSGGDSAGLHNGRWKPR